MIDFGSVASRMDSGSERHRFYDDPVGFAEQCIRWPAGESLTDYQRELLAAIPVRRKVSARGPHGLGKSATNSLAILWFASTRELSGCEWKVVTTAGAWRQLERFLWPEVAKWARRIRWDVLGCEPWSERSELLALHLKLRHGQAFAAASDNAALLEGAHADQLLIVVDEAKAVGAATFDALEGALSGADDSGKIQAFAIAMSTPGEPSGRFYDLHARKPGLEDWWCRHVTVDEAIAAKRISKSWVEQRRRQWGDGSALFQNRVLGEFASGDEDGLIPLAWIEAANERWRQWAESGKPLDGAASVGVDVARSGADKTVLALMHGDVITELRHTVREDTMQTTGRVLGVVRGWPGCIPVVDVIGVGGGVVDRLREMGVKVSAFNASEATDRRDRSGELGFVNKRAAAWWSLREMLDPAYGASLALPPDDALTGDLTAPHWSTTSTGKIQIEAKDDIRKRLGRSPDDGDAAVMAAWRVGAAMGDGHVYLEYMRRLAEGRLRPSARHEPSPPHDDPEAGLDPIQRARNAALRARTPGLPW